MGWLVAAPAEEKTNSTNGSVLAPIVRPRRNAFLQWLYRCGNTLHTTLRNSIILSNGLGIIGIIITVYGIWRLTLGAGLRIPLILIIAGTLLSVLQFIPGAGQGSYILSLFRWWSRTD